MVKNPPCNVGDVDSIPGLGTKIPNATEQLSPHATATKTLSPSRESVHCNKNNPMCQTKTCHSQINKQYFSKGQHCKWLHRQVRLRSHPCPKDTQLPLCHCQMWPLLLLGLEITEVCGAWWNTWSMALASHASLTFTVTQVHLTSGSWGV